MLYYKLVLGVLYGVDRIVLFEGVLFYVGIDNISFVILLGLLDFFDYVVL